MTTPTINHHSFGDNAERIITENGGWHTGAEDQLKPLVDESLALLGSTKESVVAHLEDLRCSGAKPAGTGEPEDAGMSAEDNPLAAYLVPLCGFAGVMVQRQCGDDDDEDAFSYSLDVAWPGTTPAFDPESPGYDDYTMGLVVPAPVAQALRAFECGQLPSLVRGDDEPYPAWLENQSV